VRQEEILKFEPHRKMKTLFNPQLR